jgi:hypothetical protein
MGVGASLDGGFCQTKKKKKKKKKKKQRSIVRPPTSDDKVSIPPLEKQYLLRVPLFCHRLLGFFCYSYSSSSCSCSQWRLQAHSNLVAAAIRSFVPVNKNTRFVDLCKFLPMSVQPRFTKHFDSNTSCSNLKLQALDTFSVVT